MIGDRSVTVFYDEVMLGHHPEVDLPYLPSRVEKRVRTLLKGLDFKWSYPEHPGRLSAIIELLEKEPIPGVQFKAGPHATYEQLGRVHTTSHLDHIFFPGGKAGVAGPGYHRRIARQYQGGDFRGRQCHRRR